MSTSDYSSILELWANSSSRRNNPNYFGSTVGRVANRISNAEFHLNRKHYTLAANLIPNHIHGGFVGWNQRIWCHETSETSGEKTVDVYSLISEDGDQAYPGQVKCTVTYTQYTEQIAGAPDKEVLEVEYDARFVDGGSVEETVFNLTNHSYFNLSGDPTIDGTVVTLPNTASYLHVDDAGIPSGYPPIQPYPGIEIGVPFSLTDRVIDNCFIHIPYTCTVPSGTRPIPLDTRSLELRTAVHACHPTTGIHLEVATTEPAFQLYTGDNISGDPKRGARAGFCVEPGRYINSVNRECWRGMVVAKKGEVYGSKIVYKAWEGGECAGGK